tara:strand:- start:753 stop:875 length:123 start_codon:yes stop_codon:yes gene_type:complete
MDSIPHFKKINEYNTYRGNKETYEMVKNTHEKKNTAIARG